MNATIAQLETIAKAHGFDATVDCTGALLVSIPFIHLQTRATGVEVYTVRTLRQLRDALGY